MPIDIRKLIGTLSDQEARLSETVFLAPCTTRGVVQTRVHGFVRRFRTIPRDFEGWGLFRPKAADPEAAGLVRRADDEQVERYLRLFPAFRLRLVWQVKGSVWLAFPANESDLRQRLGEEAVKPVALNLVTRAEPFDQVVARYDGAGWWFEDTDRRADPEHADHLREALAAERAPDEVVFANLTPEMRTAYALAFQRHLPAMERFRENRDQRRLRQALGFAGASLESFTDQGDHWLVSWRGTNGRHHRSAIAKDSLTVLSSGICLSGMDRDFDLQSLVPVINQAYDDW